MLPVLLKLTDITNTCFYLRYYNNSLNDIHRSMHLFYFRFLVFYFRFWIWFQTLYIDRDTQPIFICAHNYYGRMWDHELLFKHMCEIGRFHLVSTAQIITLCSPLILEFYRCHYPYKSIREISFHLRTCWRSLQRLRRRGSRQWGRKFWARSWWMDNNHSKTFSKWKRIRYFRRSTRRQWSLHRL